MAVQRYTGATLMIFAAIHFGVALVLFGGAFVDIFEAGVLSGPFGWSSEMLAAFWFLVFSWPVFLLGYVTQWAYARTGKTPVIVLGGGLAGVAATTLVFLPVSGLWLFVVLGLLVLFAARYPTRNTDRDLR